MFCTLQTSSHQGHLCKSKSNDDLYKWQFSKSEISIYLNLCSLSTSNRMYILLDLPSSPSSFFPPACILASCLHRSKDNKIFISLTSSVWLSFGSVLEWDLVSEESSGFNNKMACAVPVLVSIHSRQFLYTSLLPPYSLAIIIPFFICFVTLSLLYLDLLSDYLVLTTSVYLGVSCWKGCILVFFFPS